MGNDWINLIKELKNDIPFLIILFFKSINNFLTSNFFKVLLEKNTNYYAFSIEMTK